MPNLVHLSRSTMFYGPYAWDGWHLKKTHSTSVQMSVCMSHSWFCPHMSHCTFTLKYLFLKINLPDQIVARFLPCPLQQGYTAWYRICRAAGLRLGGPRTLKQELKLCINYINICIQTFNRLCMNVHAIRIFIQANGWLIPS